MKAVSGKHEWIIAGVALAALLLTGLAIFDDYGVSWDEEVQREYGEKVHAYVTQGDRALFMDRHRYYGPVVELALISLEKGLGLADSRDIYLMRHLVTFLVFWVGAVFFYLLCRRELGGWKVGLLGLVLLVVSPRIFAHAFYNSKDIPFMTVFIMGIYTLLRYLDHLRLRSAVLHAVVCALLIDIRIVGTLLVMLTIVFVAYEALRMWKKPAELKPMLLGFAIHLGIVAGLTVLFWPTLWRDPVNSFIRIFEGMRNFPWEAPVLYRGGYIWSTELPWHYIPVWIGVTSPVAVIALLFIGLVVSVRTLLGKARGAKGGVARRFVVLALCWLFLPLAYSIASKAVLYDAWRHSFFVYPALVIISLLGWGWILRQRRSGGGKVLSLVVGGFLLLSVGSTAGFMIVNHPHQNVYFNRLVGGTGGVHERFELDYWGLSYRQGLEQILERDPRDRITVHAATAPGRHNAGILKPEDRSRLVYVTEPYKADYHITNFRWDRYKPPKDSEFYSVRIDGTPIMSVYRMR
jgi:hypothetical protein